MGDGEKENGGTGRAFRLARAYLDLTVKEMADKLGWTREKLYKIERGVVAVSFTDIMLTSDVTGFPLDFFRDPDPFFRKEPGPYLSGRNRVSFPSKELVEVSPS